MSKLSESPAVRRLADAIDRDIPADVIADLLADFRDAVRREAAEEQREFARVACWNADMRFGAAGVIAAISDRED